MHNDGGNYHLVAEIKAGGTHGILVRYDDTCTLTPPEPFFKFDGGKTELADMVRKRIREGWSYSER